MADIAHQTARVDRFAEQMRTELRNNAHKGDWRECPGFTALAAANRARQELDELFDAITAGADPIEVLVEAADVANMVLMAADMYSLGLIGCPSPEETP